MQILTKFVKYIRVFISQNPEKLLETILEMLRAMYAGHCGYMSETGGIMKNLRETCSHTKVRDGEGYQGRATPTYMYPGHCGY